MAKCANCTNEALYAYKVNASFTINYCPKHLPKFLASQRIAGLLKPEPEVVAEAPKSSKKSKTETVVEEPVVEEPTVTEEPAVEDAPN